MRLLSTLLVAKLLMAGAIIIAVELTCRYFFPPLIPMLYTWDSSLGLIPAPGKSGSLFTTHLTRFHFSHGTQGFRNTGSATRSTSRQNIAQTQNTRQNDQPTILLLGDSMVYGIGVDDQDTFATQLQDLLKDRYHIINAGAPGRGPDYYLRFLSIRQKELSPAKVFVFFTGHNDWKDAYESTLYSQTLEPQAPTKPAKPHTLRFVAAAEHLLFTCIGKISQWRAATNNLSNPSEGQYKRGVGLLHAINQTATKAGCDLSFVYMPSQDDVREFRLRRMTGPHSAFTKAMESMHLSSIDLTHVLSAFPVDLSFLARESHLSPFGHRLIAQKLYETMRSTYGIASLRSQ